MNELAFASVDYKMISIEASESAALAEDQVLLLNELNRPTPTRQSESVKMKSSVAHVENTYSLGVKYKQDILFYVIVSSVPKVHIFQVIQACNLPLLLD